MGALRDVYRRLSEDMGVLGLQPFVPYSTFDEGKLDHLTFFFQHLTVRFREVRQEKEVARDAEVDRAVRAAASPILVGVHHASPHIPLRVVLEEPGVED